MISKRDIKKLKPFKKKHTGLKIFLIVLCVILVLPIAFVFGAFYDPSTKKVSDTEVHYENIVSEAFYKGICGLTTDKPELGFTINEEMFDGILMAACDKINQKTWIPKMYCYIKDNNYTFVMDAQASFFKSRALIHTNLDKQDNTLVFKITGITLGRLPLPMSLITGILGNFLNDEVLNNAFAKSGFHIESHLKESKLTYSRAQFKEDVGVYVSKLGNSKFLNVLLSTLDNPNVLSTSYKNGVYVGINFKELMTIPEEIDKPAPINFQGLENHRKEVTKLMNMTNGVKEADAPKVFTYLLRGNKSNTEIMNYITGTGEGSASNEVKDELTTYVHDELLNYVGSYIDTGSTTTFSDYCLETIEGENAIVDISKLMTDQEITFNLPSDDLNQVLAAKLDGIIGMTIPVTFKTDNKWDFQYIIVDNVYTGFTENESETDPDKQFQFNIYLQLNIGGVVPVKLVISTDNIGFESAEGNTELGHLKFKLKDINFGSINIKDIAESVVDLLPSENNVFTYNKGKGQFEVSIDKLIPEDIRAALPIQDIHDIMSSATLNTNIGLSSGDTLNITYSM